MAKMPIDPRLSRIIIEADKRDCLREISIIASALSIQDPRERPLEKETEADEAHAKFKDPQSDFLTLLNIWHACWKLTRQQPSFAVIEKVLQIQLYFFQTHARMAGYQQSGFHHPQGE